MIFSIFDLVLFPRNAFWDCSLRQESMWCHPRTSLTQVTLVVFVCIHTLKIFDTRKHNLKTPTLCCMDNCTVSAFAKKIHFRHEEFPYRKPLSQNSSCVEKDVYVCGTCRSFMSFSSLSLSEVSDSRSCDADSPVFLSSASSEDSSVIWNAWRAGVKLACNTERACSAMYSMSSFQMYVALHIYIITCIFHMGLLGCLVLFWYLHIWYLVFVRVKGESVYFMQYLVWFNAIL